MKHNHGNCDKLKRLWVLMTKSYKNMFTVLTIAR